MNLHSPYILGMGGEGRNGISQKKKCVNFLFIVLHHKGLLTHKLSHFETHKSSLAEG